jgi:hypothetical protein
MSWQKLLQTLWQRNSRIWCQPMKRECIYAWTEPSAEGVNYPAYINYSLVDDEIVVTMRGRDDRTVSMVLPREQMIEMINVPFKALLLTNNIPA